MSTPHTDQTKSEAEPEAQSESTPPTQAGVPPPTPPRLAVVFGDVTIDWNIGRLRSARQTGRSWNSEDLIRVYMQPGGAALLSELIRELAARPEVPGPPFEVLPQCENLKECVRPDSAEYNHSYANWELHKYREGQKGDGEDINSWRVKDFIGLKSVTHSDFKAFESAGEGQAKLWKEAADAIEAASAKTDGRAPDVALVVLDDAGLGFRDWGEGYWTKLRHVLVDEPEGEAGAGRQKPWVVLKMARPVADLKNNKLWEFLVEKAASRLITVVTINDLRLTEGARVSRELSWELTAQNLARELTHNEVLESLSLSRYTIVSFDTAGAFVLSRHPGEKPSDGQKARAPCPTCGLFFDPQSIEGSWAEQYPGGVIGYTSCLIASLAYQVMLHGPGLEDKHVHDAIRRGLLAMRKLLQEGYGKDATRVRGGAGGASKEMESDRPRLNLSLITEVVAGGTGEQSSFVKNLSSSLEKYCRAQPDGGAQGQTLPALDRKKLSELLRQAAEKERNWSVENLLKSDAGKESDFSYFDIKERIFDPGPPARRRAARGVSDYWTILSERHATSAGPKLREELTELAKAIVVNGLEDSLKDVPVGKFQKLTTVDRQEIESFRAIGALIREYVGQERPERPLSIAVFGPPGSGKSFGIAQVAQSVTRIAVKKLTFNLSQLTRPDELFEALHQVRDEALAGSVPLVFWDEFDTRLNQQKLGWLHYFLAPMQDGQFQQGQVTHPVGRSIFVFAGGTCETMEDFDKSRHATANVREEFHLVKGPDFISRLKGYINILGPNPKGKNVEADPEHVIRRAILLRSILEREAKQLFEKPDGKGALSIDGGVLTAFLTVDEYKFGVRSMESIIAMSRLGGMRKFERSSLPTKSQLKLHVMGSEFSDLVE